MNATQLTEFLDSAIERHRYPTSADVLTLDVLDAVTAMQERRVEGIAREGRVILKDIDRLSQELVVQHKLASK